MIRIFKYITFIIALLTVSACQKVINLNLDSAASQIVIEANINNIKGSQTVTISKSVPFTSTNNYPPVSGATVTLVETKGNSYTLTESPTIPGTYAINNVAGRPGFTYTLTVKLNGQTYTAVSTMPMPIVFLPMTFTNDVFNNGSKAPVIHFTDPPNIANNYRFVLYVNGTQIKDIYVSDDTFTDGGGLDIALYQNDITIKTGDQIIVDDQGIDRNVFLYWYSLSQQQGGGVGGTAPANPPSNISGGALGYFSAHTSVVQSTIVR